MNRLEQLTKNADKKTAATASEALAHVTMVKLMADTKPMEGLFQEGSDGPVSVKDGINVVAFGLKGLACLLEMEQHLRRAVQLDPSREPAWDLLTQMLNETFRVAEAIAVCERRIKIKDNAHNRFLLANCFASKEQYDRAANHLRAGIAKDEKDLNCRLALIAVLLRRGDTEALKEAGMHLGALEPRFKPGKNKSRLTHFLLLRGLHAALRDQPDRAKELFRRVLKENINERAAVSALAALGEPATPADESLAIAYLQTRRAKIERKHKQPDASVVKVSLTEDNIEEDDLFFLSAFPQLRDLRLYSHTISDAGLVHIERLASLQRLDLNCYQVTDKGLLSLKPLTNLRSLDLDYAKVTDAGLAHLDSFPQLETLHLPGWYSTSWNDEIKQTITDTGLAHLCKLTNLRDLSLPPALTDKRLASLLGSLPRLRKLRTVFPKITDDGMKCFAGGDELRELWLCGANISDAGLAHLQGLRHLKTLYLDKTKITDAGLAKLKGITDLECLVLDDTAVTDAGLVHLGATTHLRKLRLEKTTPRESCELELLSFISGFKSRSAKPPAKLPLTDAGLEHLQRLTALEQLHLSGQAISNSGLSHLARMTNLRQLYLGGTSVTDAGLRYLLQLKRLKYVDLRATKVTDKGVAELRKEFPKLEISR